MYLFRSELVEQAIIFRDQWRLTISSCGRKWECSFTTEYRGVHRSQLSKSSGEHIHMKKVKTT